MGKGLGEVGREMLVWVLEHEERELEATKNSVTKTRAIRRLGPKYGPELYREDGHPEASSASQHQTRRSLERQGLLEAYPETGHVRHLKLTTAGRKAAVFCRDHGGCSPSEMKKAVRRSSQYARALAHRSAQLAGRPPLRTEGPTEAFVVFLAWLDEAQTMERRCRTYLDALPPDKKKAEVKRIIAEGLSSPLPIMPLMPVFTDGGTVPWPPPPEAETAPPEVLN